MRILNVLLAVYVLILSVCPCTEEHHHHTESASAVASIEADQHASHDHHGASAHCSPFCVCHCLGGFVSLAYSLPELAVSVLLPLPKSTFWYDTAQPREYHLSIWQPPLLA
ncbi:MAG: hypothetical protein QM669_00735 [Siphonobacter sp.]